MTVAVACNLPEGVVLGVDSAVTLNNQKGQVVKVYENAEKLFQLGSRPVGIAAYGMGSLGARNVGSYVREFELKDPGHVVSQPTTVAAITEELRRFFSAEYQSQIVPALEATKGKKFADIPDNEKPILGLVVGGFSDKAYLSEVWEITIPFHDKPGSAKQWCKEGEFRPVWFAINGPIVRYVKGYDPNLMTELVQHFGTLRGSPVTPSEQAAIQSICDKHEYAMPFMAMPIEEGAAYVRFVVEMVINHHRFAVGAPIVGGKARIGLVTYKGEQFRLLSTQEFRMTLPQQ